MTKSEVLFYSIHFTPVHEQVVRKCRLDRTLAAALLATYHTYFMPHKKVPFRGDARAKILSGSTALADAIQLTIAPKSRSVLSEHQWGGADGVTMARELNLPDLEKNLEA